ncbi:uncharacterized protein [Haliotis asinina]|uniref:uncharacterized protein n=1 Tax=Haliotis asinina TaxID=109174 RepID=UPI003532165C
MHVDFALSFLKISIVHSRPFCAFKVIHHGTLSRLIRRTVSVHHRGAASCLVELHPTPSTPEDCHHGTLSRLVRRTVSVHHRGAASCLVELHPTPSTPEDCHHGTLSRLIRRTVSVHHRGAASCLVELHPTPSTPEDWHNLQESKVRKSQELIRLFTIHPMVDVHTCQYHAAVLDS